MKHFLFIVFTFAIFSNTVLAQDAKPRHNIYVGAGHSIAKLVFINSIALEGDPISVKSNPAFQMTYDYTFAKRWQVGAAFSHQRFRDTLPLGLSVVFLNDSITQGNTPTKIQYNRNNIAFRIAYNLVSREHFELYIGSRLGATFWKTRANYYEKGEKKTFNAIIPSPQGFLGMRYYFTKNFGLSIESGFGAPHFLSTGINYRF